MTIALTLFYICTIVFVGTFLFVAIDWLEPNPRLAFIFKCALLAAGGVTIIMQLIRSASGLERPAIGGSEL
jgi:hypothetical protein